MGKRKIPEVNLKEYADVGAITAQPYPVTQEVRIELHKCNVFLSQGETMRVALSLVHAAYRTFGNAWLQEFQRHCEQLTEDA